MAKITSWQAERQGRYQGNPTSGGVARAVGKAISDIGAGKVPKVPKVEMGKGRWQTWPETTPFIGDQPWLDGQVASGTLPDIKGDFEWTSAGRVDQREADGAWIIVQMLDTTAETRQRVVFARLTPDSLVLMAKADAWRARLVPPGT